MRELLRNVLSRLSPNHEIQNCSWYSPDASSQTGITRIHRMKYALQGGLSDEFISKRLKLNDEIEYVSNALKEVINLLSEYTHIEEQNFNLEQDLIEEKASECFETIERFLSLLHQVHEMVVDSLDSKLTSIVDNSLFEELIMQSVEELMDISTHYFAESVWVEKSKIIKIMPDRLIIGVNANIECELQYGSNSDVRKGIGHVEQECFPVEASFEIMLERPLGSKATLLSAEVDNSSFFE